MITKNTQNSKVCVIDDEKNIGLVIQAMLENAGFEVVTFQESLKALDYLKTNEVDAVVTDLYMPGPGGMEVLKASQDYFPQVPVIMITAFATVESAVAALKTGAFDFITKPFDQGDLLAVVQKAVQTHRQRLKEPVSITSRVSSLATRSADSLSLVGNSAPIKEVLRIIPKIAATRTTVLLSGESGTGKELVAFEIHRQSERIEKPFIKINCAAIPSTLIESELFGYERGAFTGAVASKPGRFELAHEGTLFLDEVADMPVEMQAKHLRVLQYQEFVRVGGVNSIRVDVRLIAATNKDLSEEVKAGRFREDLFYRLNVVPVHLPPLRERREDIESLVQVFIAQFNQKFNKAVSLIEPLCLTALKQSDWPGNIRQLENVLERLVLMSEGTTLRFDDLPGDLVQSLKAKEDLLSADSAVELGNFKEAVRRHTQTFERELIERALEETQGNVTRAAEKLGLSRKGLQLKLKELGIKRGGDDKADEKAEE